MTNDNSSSCVTAHNPYPLDNTGTLSIVMKAPDNDDPCDPHVRAAYREMLLLLDDTSLDPPLPANKNVNQQIAFIDPAVDVNQKGPVFDGDTTTELDCRGIDDPPYTSLASLNEQKNSDEQGSSEGMPRMEMANILAPLNEISNAVNRISESGRESLRIHDPYLILPIQRSLLSDRNLYPSISQMAVLSRLFRQSMKAIRKQEVRHTDPALLSLLKSEIQFLSIYDQTTKGAKDCLAVIMTAN